MSTKLITVFGSTGTQGGSVVRSLLQDKSGEFKIRGITRNPDSDAAKKLASAGVEVVKADGLKKEEMVEAFKGSWGVFVNTNSDDPALDEKNGPTETDLGRLIIDSAVEAGVKHFVYSGMTSAATITQGAIPVDAFDEKSAIGDYARSTDAFSTTTVVSAGWYFENFINKEFAPLFGGFPYDTDEEGYLTFRFPKWGGKEDVPFISIRDDFGDLVHGIFLDPTKYDGAFVQAVSEISPASDVVETFQAVTGKKSRFQPAPWQDMETHGVKELMTVKLMFAFCQYSGGLYYGVPTESDSAAALKKAAAEAQGKSGKDAQLMSAKEYFKREFAGQ